MGLPCCTSVFPSVNLGFFSPPSWGECNQSTRSLFLLFATSGPGLEEVPHSGASVGESSGLKFSSTCQLASQGAVEGVAPICSPAGLWVLAGASACPGSLFSVLIGCPLCQSPGSWLIKAVPFRASEEAPMGLPTVVSPRRGQNSRKVLGRPRVGSVSKPRVPGCWDSLLSTLPALYFMYLPIPLQRTWGDLPREILTVFGWVALGHIKSVSALAPLCSLVSEG